ncbi:hypothetical protein GCM10010435_79470 [Winogradskya consettensis]|uniref:Uncharacterized protein n=1 Tax=Winogradskya consettensis TaxID=113560 RepID=A0A919SS09_9ACTN|nr:hypothetical protein Aco04nite_55490 [Actinoplanes consettensis]
MWPVQNSTHGFGPLLAAYPARMRRRHGAELIATLIEMAGPDGRSSRAARWQLAADGLRERFRLPGGRPLAVVAAVLALVVGGALGAAGGSWVGTTLYADLPGAESVAAQMLPPGGTPLSHTGDSSYLNVMDTIAAGLNPAEAAEVSRQKMEADGWDTTSVGTGDGSDGLLRNAHFHATNGNTELSVYAYYATADVDPMISIAGWPSRPAAFVPLTIAGLVLGMIVGWLVAAALTHRIAAARRRRPAALLGGAGLTLLLLPATTFFASLAYYLTGPDTASTGGRLHTGDAFTFGPTMDLLRETGVQGVFGQTGTYLSCTLTGFTLIAIAAIAARPHPAGEAPDPVGALPA